MKNLNQIQSQLVGLRIYHRYAVTARAFLRAFPLLVYSAFSLRMSMADVNGPLQLHVLRALATICTKPKFTNDYLIGSNAKGIQSQLSSSLELLSKQGTMALQAQKRRSSKTHAVNQYLQNGTLQSRIISCDKYLQSLIDVIKSVKEVEDSSNIILSSSILLSTASQNSDDLEKALVLDLDAIKKLRPSKLMLAPLWTDGMPKSIFNDWEQFVVLLKSFNDDWQVWIDWYNAVLSGKPTPGGEELDIFRVTLNSEEDWKKGPAYVNALIKAEGEKNVLLDHGSAIPQEIDGPAWDFDSQSGLLTPVFRQSYQTESEVADMESQ